MYFVAYYISLVFIEVFQATNSCIEDTSIPVSLSLDRIVAAIFFSVAVLPLVRDLCIHKLTSFSEQSLRGPRGGMIFFKKDPVLGVDLESAINNAVFPGLQVVRLCSSSITMNVIT